MNIFITSELQEKLKVFIKDVDNGKIRNYSVLFEELWDEIFPIIRDKEPDKLLWYNEKKFMGEQATYSYFQSLSLNHSIYESGHALKMLEDIVFGFIPEDKSNAIISLIEVKFRRRFHEINHLRNPYLKEFCNMFKGLTQSNIEKFLASHYLSDGSLSVYSIKCISREACKRKKNEKTRCYR